MGRVSGGKGQGRDSCTLEKPLPLVGVKGMYPYPYPCQGSRVICIRTHISHIFTEENVYFHIKNLVFGLYRHILHRIGVLWPYFVD